MTPPDALLLANACATWSMCGLIAFVHRVHYPLFERYARDDYATTQRLHESRTSLVVGPPMLVELLTGLALPFAPPANVSAWQAWLGVALIAAIWASTALWQIPAHRALGNGFDATAHARLVTTNRWRTLAWFARGALTATMLAGRMKTGT